MAMTDEEKREYQRKWRERNPEKCKEYERKWQKNNRDKFRARNNEYQRKYREKNSEKHRSKSLEWAKNNPTNVARNRENSRNRYKVAILSPKAGKWTDGEISFLVKNLSLPVLEISIVLNRTYSATTKKISRLRKAGIIE